MTHRQLNPPGAETGIFRQSYMLKTMTYLLMPWIHAPPDDKHPGYHHCRINDLLSPMRKDINFNIIMGKLKYQCNFLPHWKVSVCNQLIALRDAFQEIK